MLRRSFLAALAATALAAGATPAAAQETVKIGLIIPLTGPFTTTGKQLEAAAKLYMEQNGTTVAGKKIELIVRDDAGRAENTARIAGELIQNDKVSFLAGFGLTPLAMTTAPIATNWKVPMVVMMAGTSIITERSPYIVRTSFTLGQSAVIIADWAAQNKIKKVVTLVTDYAPGHDAENLSSISSNRRAARSSKASACRSRTPTSHRFSSA
jgi:branched-chain amino acid transport system substrate-binding protein